MFNAMNRPRRRPPSFAARSSAVSFAALAAALGAFGTASAQSTRPTAATPPVQAAANANTSGGGPDLQGLWDFTIRVAAARSPDAASA